MSSAKTADLCWGQRYIWLRYQQLPANARQDTHLVRTFAIPDQVGMPVLRTTLNYLVRRHEALRTTVHSGPHGEPRQYVHPPGPLAVRTASTEADDTPTPAAVVDELSTTEFDLATEWPIRACVITTGGRPIRLVLVLNHLAFDAWTIDAFEREFAALGAGVLARRPAVLEPVRHQPADLARYEATPAATELRDRAVEHWREELTRLPTDMFAARRTDAPGACRAVLTSPAMLDAGRRIAERNQLWPSAVHLTAYTLVMGAYTGAAAVSHLAFTGNRDAVPYTDVMTCMFTPAPSAVELADDPTFDELLARVADRFDTSRRYAYLPYDELVELLARESVRRGAEVRLGSEVNFLARPGDRTGARRSRLTWQSAPSAWAAYGADSYLRIDETQDALRAVPAWLRGGAARPARTGRGPAGAGRGRADRLRRTGVTRGSVHCGRNGGQGGRGPGAGRRGRRGQRSGPGRARGQLHGRRWAGAAHPTGAVGARRPRLGRTVGVPGGRRPLAARTGRTPQLNERS